MAKIKRPTGPNAEPTYDAPKAKKPPKRTHGTHKDHRAAKKRAQQKRQQPSGAAPVADSAIDDTQLNLIAQNHQDYFDTLVNPQFRGMSTNPYWNQHAENAFRQAETGYTQALFQNPDLHYATYMQQQGAGGGVGRLAPLGTGQAGQVDTGNPFTSSSGIGAVPVAPAAPGPALGKRPNRNHPNQLKRWKKAKKAGVPGAPEPATLGQVGINPMAPGTGYTDRLRRDFLALSPQERGDVALGKVQVPGRWSPWG